MLIHITDWNQGTMQILLTFLPLKTAQQSKLKNCLSLIEKVKRSKSRDKRDGFKKFGNFVWLQLIFGQKSCFLGPRQLVRQELSKYSLRIMKLAVHATGKNLKMFSAHFKHFKIAISQILLTIWWNPIWSCNSLCRGSPHLRKIHYHGPHLRA